MITNQLQKSVYFIQSDVILIDQPPAMTVQKIEVLFDKLEELLIDKETVFILLDISKSDRPNAEMRAQIIKRLNMYSSKLEHIVICTGKNDIKNVVIKFIFGFLKLQPYSIFKTQEECLDHIKKC